LHITDCTPLPLTFDSITYLPVLIKTLRRIQRAIKLLKIQTLVKGDTQNIIPQYEIESNKGQSTCGHVGGL